MQATIQYMAQRHKESDAFLLELLKELSPEQLNAPIKSFAGTILGLYLHCFESNKNRFLPIAATFSKKELPTFEIKDRTSLAEITAVATALNEELYTLFTGLTDSQLDTSVEMGNRGSLLIEVAITRWALHNTHHRGQISQILDELGVDHDMFLMKRP